VYQAVENFSSGWRMMEAGEGIVDWGMFGEDRPLVVEEDAAVLLDMADPDAMESKGWKLGLTDKSHEILGFQKAHPTKPELNVMSATIVVRGWTAREICTELFGMRKLTMWDQIFSEIIPVRRVNEANMLCHYRCSPPSGMFATMVTVRDFLHVSMMLHDPITGCHVFVLRCATHSDVPPAKGYIRAQNLGCIGFVVTSLEKNVQRMLFATATDMGGWIPAWIVNAVAPRIPARWISKMKDHMKM